MLKLLLGAALAALSLGASEPAAEAELAAIAIVRCGPAVGTAFAVAPGRIVTAAHVAANGPCAIPGRHPGAPLIPAPVLRQDRRLDIAELRADLPGAPLPIACTGLRPGQMFRAIGYAGGLRRLTSPLFATRNRDSASAGLVVLLGRVERGMSGGPVLDQPGRVAGIVNRHSPARSRSLEETFLCRP